MTTELAQAYETVNVHRREGAQDGNEYSGMPIVEAARLDGVGGLKMFRYITIPSIRPSLIVVLTTISITTLKAFDIVYVMTTGHFDTQVVAFQMINELYNFGHPGRASAIAVILLLAIIPVMAINIRRFQAQEALR